MSILMKLYQVTPNGVTNEYKGTFKIAVAPPLGGVVRYTLDPRGPFTQGVVTLIVYDTVISSDASEPTINVTIDARPPKAILGEGLS